MYQLCMHIFIYTHFKHIHIYPLFLMVNRKPLKTKPKIQPNQGHLGSRYIFILNISILLTALKTEDLNFPTFGTPQESEHVTSPTCPHRSTSPRALQNRLGQKIPENHDLPLLVPRCAGFKNAGPEVGFQLGKL